MINTEVEFFARSCQVDQISDLRFIPADGLFLVKYFFNL